MTKHLPFRILSLGLSFCLSTGPVFARADVSLFQDKKSETRIPTDFTILNDGGAGSREANIQALKSFIEQHRAELGILNERNLDLHIDNYIVTGDGSGGSSAATGKKMTSIRLQQMTKLPARTADGGQDSETREISVPIIGAMVTALFDENGRLMSLNSGLVAPPAPLPVNQKNFTFNIHKTETEEDQSPTADDRTLSPEEQLNLAKAFEMIFRSYSAAVKKGKNVGFTTTKPDASGKTKSAAYSLKDVLEMTIRKQGNLITRDHKSFLERNSKEKLAVDPMKYLFSDEKGKNFYHFVSQLSKRSLLRIFSVLHKQKRAGAVVQKLPTGELQYVVRLVYPFDVPIQIDIDSTTELLKVTRVLSLAHKAFEVTIEKPGLLWPQMPAEAILPDVNSRYSVGALSKSDDPRLQLGYVMTTTTVPQQVNRQIFAPQPATTKDLVDARDAAFNILKAVEFFRDTFNWNSYNNQGSPIKAVVSVNAEGLAENAAWAGSPFNMFIFGAGGKDLYNLPKGTDVIGHEFFHAVVSATSALDKGDQCGALNEHGADVFGVAVQKSSDGTVDWQIGETVLTPSAKAKGSSLRNMLHPELSWSSQPSSMNQVQEKFVRVNQKLQAPDMGAGKCVTPSPDNDNCLVHYQAGVPNLAVANSVEQVARATGKDNRVVFDSMSRILFNVFTMRLRSQSDFNDYLREILGECQRLSGSLEGINSQSCQIIKVEFNKVGIGVTLPIVQPGMPSISPGSTKPEAGTLDPNDPDYMKKLCIRMKDAGVQLPAFCQNLKL